MKKIFRKNQLIITALALMIAVAGYFSYMNNSIDDNDAAAKVSAGAEILEEEYEISDEDTDLVGEIFTDEGRGEEIALVDDTGQTGTTQSTETAAEAEIDTSAQTAEDVAMGENAEETNPGETILTSTTIANLDYAAEMKLNREQIRSKNKEALLEIVNNAALADNLKQDAVNKMVAMTDIAEREAAAEMLLEAKGFTDVVVSITDDNCDVVLNMGEVTDSKRAQVEDIVKRKTNVSAEHIVITPIVVNEAQTTE